MAIIQLQLRQGPEADRALITPLEGEIIYTTDTKSIYVGDGVTVGGTTPKVPAPPLGVADSSTHPANTEFVHSVLNSITGVNTAAFAVKTAPNTFTQQNTFEQYPVITAPILDDADSTNKIPTTAWVQNLVDSAKPGDLSDFASKSNPNTFSNQNDFTISPTVPNPSFNDSSNKVATTKFVKDMVSTIGNISTVAILPGTGTTVNYSDGIVTLPNGDTVNVAAGSKVLPPSGTHYLVVDGTGAVSVASSFPQQPDAAVIATVYTNGGAITNISTTGLDLRPYAQLSGANFTGPVEAPTPEAADNSRRVVTTEWINDRFGPPGQENNYVTEDWVVQKVIDILTKPIDGDSYPMVYVTEGLHINTTAGTVPKPGGGECVIDKQCDIAVDANTTTYVWVRYADCSVIVTTTEPASNIGLLLATVTSNSNSITGVDVPEDVRVDTFITRHFRAAFGGTLIYMP